jgi:hypothetical protein
MYKTNFKMRKVAMMVACLAATMFFTACGDKDDTENTDEKEMTASDFLAEFGLTEEKIKPAGTSALTLNQTGKTVGKVQITAPVDMAKAQAWVNAVVPKIQAIADNGKVLETTITGPNTFTDADYVIPVYTGNLIEQWHATFTYFYNGKRAWVSMVAGTRNSTSSYDYQFGINH